MDICKVCNSSNVNIVIVEEKQYATFEKFDYLHCLACGSLIIKEIPVNLSKFYPKDYYSFSGQDSTGFIKKWIKNKYWQHITSTKQKNLIGYIIEFFYKTSEENIFNIISGTKIHLESRILDIGCGSGELLKRLRQFGYINTLGIDPNVAKDIFYNNTRLVIKSDINNYSIQSGFLFDLIMFNHSFEHIPNPEEVLTSIKIISKKSSRFLIRIPLSNSYAFEHYKENWVQLDAPRHLYLYSEKGIRIMLEKSGFEILDIIYDSTEFQFWGSEQYSKNISLLSENSYKINSAKSIFSKQDILNFKEKAKNLNNEKKGDMAAFIFKLKSS